MVGSALRLTYIEPIQEKTKAVMLVKVRQKVKIDSQIN